MGCRRRLTVLTLLLLLFIEALASWNFEVKGDGCNVSLSISPRTVYTVPHQPHKITVRWKSDCSCKVRISYPVLGYAKGNITSIEWLGGGGDFRLLNEKGRFVEGFSIGKGSGSRILYLYAPDGVVGEFKIKFKVFHDRSLVLTKVLTVKTDAGKPIGSISKVDPPALTLRQMHMPILLAEGGKFEVEYRLSKATYRSVINASCSPGLNYYVTTLTLLRSKGEGKVKLFISPLPIRTNPGEYHVNLTLFKRIFYYEYFEESGTYNATSYKDVLLAEAKVPITVVKIPNEPYLEAKVEILDASYKIETEDNVRFNVALDLEAGYYSKKINGSKLIPPWHYVTLSGLAAPSPKFFKDNVGLWVVTGLVSEDGSLFYRTVESVYHPVHENFKIVSEIPRSMYALWLPHEKCLSADIYNRGWYVIKCLAIRESDDSWEFMGSSSSWLYKSIKELESKEFPYLKFEIVRGKIAFHHEALYNLTIYDIYLLSRSRALLVSAYVAANFREKGIWCPWFAVPGYDSVKIPFTFKPPFTSVDGRVKLSPNGFKVDLKKTKDGRYNLVLTIYLNASGEAECAFSKEIRDLGDFLDIHEPWGAEGYSAAWVLNATTNSKINRLYTLPFRAITGEYRTWHPPSIIYPPLPLKLVKRFKLSKEKVGEIAIGVNLTARKPSLHELRRIKFEGNYSLTFKWVNLTRSMLKSTNTLRLELTLFDWLFNKRVHEATLELDVGDAIKRALKAIKNKPPKARFEYTPKRPKPGDTVTVRSLSEDPDGYIVAYRWVIYEDGKVIKKAVNVTSVSFTVEAGKTYTVELTVTDDEGAVASSRVTVVSYLKAEGNVLIEIETEIHDDLTVEAAPLAIGVADISSFEIEVKHGSYVKRFRKNPLQMEDLIFRNKNGKVITGVYFLTIKGDYPRNLQRHFNASEAFNTARIKYEINVTKDGIKFIIIRTRNCIVKPKGKDWYFISPFFKTPHGPFQNSIDVSEGFNIRIRPYAVWEMLLRKTLIKFLTEANVGEAQRLINNLKVEYGYSPPKFIDTAGNLIRLPYPHLMFSLEYTRSGFSTSIAFGDFFEEAGHYIRFQCFTDTGGLFNPKQWLINAHLYGSPHAVNQPFPITIKLLGYPLAYIPIPRLSAFGAFDEGHTEFLRTLIIDYLKCQPYINFTTPLPEKADFYTTPDFYGFTNLIKLKVIRFTGNTVEGRVAGLLLAVLYWNDEDPRYHPDAERAVNAYRLFWSAVHSARMVMNRYPLIVDEVIYMLIAKYLSKKPDMWDLAVHYMSPTKYNMPNSLRIRPFRASGSTVIGKPVLIYNLAPEAVAPTAKVYDGFNNYYLTSGDLIYITAVDGSTVSSLLPQYYPIKVVIFSHDGGLSGSITLRGALGRIKFERRWIRVLNGEIHAFIPAVGELSVRAGGVLVIPKSEFILNVTDGEFSGLVTIKGKVTIKSNATEVKVAAGEAVKASPKGELETYKIDTAKIERWWNIKGEINIGGFPRRSGDIDGDGYLTIADLVRVLRMALGLEEAIATADMNDDGVIDKTDVNLLIKEIMK